MLIILSGRVDAASGIGFIGAFEVGVVVGFLCMSGCYESWKFGCKKKTSKKIGEIKFPKKNWQTGKK